jgi:hypothetical protein
MAEAVHSYGRNHSHREEKNFHQVVSFFEWIVYIESESIVRLGKRRRAVVKKHSLSMLN